MGGTGTLSLEALSALVMATAAALGVITDVEPGGSEGEADAGEGDGMAALSGGERARSGVLVRSGVLTRSVGAVTIMVGAVAAAVRVRGGDVLADAPGLLYKCTTTSQTYLYGKAETAEPSNKNTFSWTIIQLVVLSERLQVVDRVCRDRVFLWNRGVKSGGTYA